MRHVGFDYARLVEMVDHSPIAWSSSSHEALVDFWDWFHPLHAALSCREPDCDEPILVFKASSPQSGWWCNLHNPHNPPGMRAMIAATQKNRLRAKKEGLL